MKVTLNTLDKASPQDVVNTVVNGLAAQNWEQSLADIGDPICQYRGTHNRKCAAGQLMTDAEYAALNRFMASNFHTLDMAMSSTDTNDNHTIEGIAWDLLTCRSVVPGTHSRLIFLLQRCHDRADNPEDMKKALRLTITNENLEVPAKLR